MERSKTLSPLLNKNDSNEHFLKTNKFKNVGLHVFDTKFHTR